MAHLGTGFCYGFLLCAVLLWDRRGGKVSCLVLGGRWLKRDTDRDEIDWDSTLGGWASIVGLLASWMCLLWMVEWMAPWWRDEPIEGSVSFLILSVTSRE